MPHCRWASTSSNGGPVWETVDCAGARAEPGCPAAPSVRSPAKLHAVQPGAAPRPGLPSHPHSPAQSRYAPHPPATEIWQHCLYLCHKIHSTEMCLCLGSDSPLATASLLRAESVPSPSCSLQLAPMVSLAPVCGMSVVIALRPNM